MSNNPVTNSPFMKREQRQLSFGTILLLLLMVVAAGLALLIYYALRVPAITSELDAWLGRQTPSVDTASSREAQIVFILFCYAAPLMLGVLVNCLHAGINYIDRVNEARTSVEDDPFRMEKE